MDLNRFEDEQNRSGELGNRVKEVVKLSDDQKIKLCWTEQDE